MKAKGKGKTKQLMLMPSSCCAVLKEEAGWAFFFFFFFFFKSRNLDLLLFKFLTERRSRQACSIQRNATLAALHATACIDFPRSPCTALLYLFCIICGHCLVACRCRCSGRPLARACVQQVGLLFHSFVLAAKLEMLLYMSSCCVRACVPLEQSMC
jgi:hypothetical protein